jgi:hypothetical protein
MTKRKPQIVDSSEGIPSQAELEAMALRKLSPEERQAIDEDLRDRVFRFPIPAPKEMAEKLEAFADRLDAEAKAGRITEGLARTVINYHSAWQALESSPSEGLAGKLARFYSACEVLRFYERNRL